MYCYFSAAGMDIYVKDDEIEVQVLFEGFYIPFYMPLDEFKKTIIEKYGQFTGIEIRNEIEDYIDNTIMQN